MSDKDQPNKDAIEVSNKPKQDLVHPGADGYVERVTPIKPPDTVSFFKCECNSVHYRHAGYMKTMVPFLRSGGDKRVDVHDYQVMVCVACKNSYVWINEQMYDVTDKIDLSAWEKTEKEAHRATGPGGQC